MRLLARNGPLAGASLTLSDGLTIGTADGHQPLCRVNATKDGSFRLESLVEHQPVFVNGLPTVARTLEPHDELRIGDSLFIVRADEMVAAPGLTPCAVRVEVLPAAPGLQRMRFDDALMAEQTSDTREARDLAALLRVGAALSSIHGLAAIDGALAGLLLDVVPVDRVALAGIDEGATSVRSAWSLPHASPEPLAVDLTLLERVAKERTATVVQTGGRQVIVAPMVAFGQATGSVWAEGRPGASLDEGHVQLLMVVSAFAAVAREQARETERLQETNEGLRAEINLEHNMVGRSRLMQALFERIARAANTDSTILLRGESGTGKELVARAVHRNSTRAEQAFIAINCAAITESLLESELFGHEKGAFTGAIGLKKGKLELAAGGTLFLDEIGELPITLQAKLLRALQEREFERVGGTRPIRVDFRLIAATNRDLEAAVKAAEFRQDLFYRLNVVMLTMPPLRDRREDIPLLADYFVRKHAPRCGRRIMRIDKAALARLGAYDWPGNVRELENIIEQALALGTGDRISVDDLPAGFGERGASGPASLDYHESVERTKRELILRAFERSDQNHAEAARLLGVHPNYLHRLIRNFDLRRDRSRQRPSR
jgi:transcriptional regulator with GAF, ATPase, and Fis domain